MSATPTPDAYLLDTSVASIAWDGGNADHAWIRSRLETLGDSTISVCAISIGEVAYGLAVTPNADLARHALVRNAMREYFVWPIGDEVTEVYSRLRGELFSLYAPRNRRGLITAKWPEALRETSSARELGIQENDLWIVSLAITHDLCLITRDTKSERILEVAKKLFAYERYELWLYEPSSPA